MIDGVKGDLVIYGSAVGMRSGVYHRSLWDTRSVGAGDSLQASAFTINYRADSNVPLNDISTEMR